MNEGSLHAKCMLVSNDWSIMMSQLGRPPHVGCMARIDERSVGACWYHLGIGASPHRGLFGCLDEERPSLVGPKAWCSVNCLGEASSLLVRSRSNGKADHVLVALSCLMVLELVISPNWGPHPMSSWPLFGWLCLCYSAEGSLLLLWALCSWPEHNSYQ